MQKDYIGDLFCDAQKNNASLEELTNYLINYGRKIAKSLIAKYGIFNLTVDDVDDYILFLINYVYSTYNSSRKDFFDYTTFIFKKRLTAKIIELCKLFSGHYYSLDETFDDGNCYHDLIEDNRSLPIPEQVSLDEFKLKMSSPLADDDSFEVKKKKVYLLINSGYSSAEIMKKLRLTLGQYRYIKKAIKNDLDLFKIK